MRLVLKSDYVGLCDSSILVIFFFFGDDFLKLLKEVREMGNVGCDYLLKNGRWYGFY